MHRSCQSLMAAAGFMATSNLLIVPGPARRNTAETLRVLLAMALGSRENQALESCAMLALSAVQAGPARAAAQASGQLWGSSTHHKHSP